MYLVSVRLSVHLKHLKAVKKMVILSDPPLIAISSKNQNFQNSKYFLSILIKIKLKHWHSFEVSLNVFSLIKNTLGSIKLSKAKHKHILFIF